jgi:hypothetical protein
MIMRTKTPARILNGGDDDGESQRLAHSCVDGGLSPVMEMRFANASRIAKSRRFNCANRQERWHFGGM